MEHCPPKNPQLNTEAWVSFSGHSILSHINTRKVTHPASADENNRSPVFGTSPDLNCALWPLADCNLHLLPVINSSHEYNSCQSLVRPSKWIIEPVGGWEPPKSAVHVRGKGDLCSLILYLVKLLNIQIRKVERKLSLFAGHMIIL